MRTSIASWAVRQASWLASRLPLRAALAIGFTAAYVVYLLDSRRKAAYASAKSALGDEYFGPALRRIVRLSYLNMGRTAVEVLRMPVTGEDYFRTHFTFSGQERIDQGLSKKRGLVLASAHFGSWELGHVLMNAYGYPTKVVARPQPIDELDHLLNAHRVGGGTRVILKGMGVREAFRALRRGEVLAVAQDQSGGAQGMYTRFFGRRTSFPAGVFKLAYRTGAPILPAFVIREGWDRCVTHIFDPRVRARHESEEEALRLDLEYYVHFLEKCIRQFPGQWLWMHRRWKYTRTKTVCILTDGKAGHRTQSEAVLEAVKKAWESRDPLMEVRVNEIAIRFKSPLHRLSAYFLTFLLLPWIQGRLALVGWTLDTASFERLKKASADLVLSTGSVALPMLAALARETCAKKLVVMKPSFPYSLLRYEAALMPEHDRPSRVRNSFFLELAPNIVSAPRLAEAGGKIRGSLSLPDGRYVTVFIGGDAKDYEMDLVKMDFVFRDIRSVAEEFDARLLITTSRRTSRKVEDLTKKHFQNDSLCPLLVIANEKNIDDAVYGMMDLADVIVVTDDSISMISESIASSKPVIILRAASGRLRPKFERFHQLIQIKNYAVMSTTSELRHHLETFLNRERTLSSCPDRSRLVTHLAGAL